MTTFSQPRTEKSWLFLKKSRPRIKRRGLEGVKGEVMNRFLWLFTLLLLGSAGAMAQGTHKLDASVSFNRWSNDGSNEYLNDTPYVGPAGSLGFGENYSYQYRPQEINNRNWEAKIEYENKVSERLKLEATTTAQTLAATNTSRPLFCPQKPKNNLKSDK